MTDGTVAVTNDGRGIADALVAALRARGVDASRVDDLDGPQANNLIFLGGLREVTSVDDALAINREAFMAARAFKQHQSEGGFFATVSDLGGNFGLDQSSLMNGQSARAWTGGLGGLAKTAAIEWPSTTVRSIDIATGQRSVGEIAGALASEILTGGSDLEIGLGASGERVTLRSTPVAVAPGPQPLEASDVIVVSGGGRGVTARDDG